MYKQPLQPCIFVVDDEPVIASSLGTILCQNGFDARSFAEPLEALLAAHSEVPDLLITDVMMPALSGIELATQVQAICPDCRVWLFSGQAAGAHLAEIARAEGHNFELLLKPVHPNDLLKKLAGIFDQTS